MVTTETPLIERHIKEDLHRPGPSEARLVASGVSVWAIIGYLPTVDGEIDQVAEDYDIEPEAVRAAIAYYHQERAAIDARLAANAGSRPIHANHFPAA
ncbi:MAG: DUF433 domain-containing protein [Chloroflexia bacterium]|nr:DUF433 domain-containing protein [Chloroflexia bacterium]